MKTLNQDSSMNTAIISTEVKVPFKDVSGSPLRFFFWLFSEEAFVMPDFLLSFPSEPEYWIMPQNTNRMK